MGGVGGGSGSKSGVASSVVGGVAGSVAGGLPGSSISTEDYSSGGMRAPSSTNQPLSSSAFQVQLIHLNVSKDVHYYFNGVF